MRRLLCHPDYRTEMDLLHCGDSLSLGHRYTDKRVVRGPIPEYRHVAPIIQTRFVSPSLLGLLEAIVSREQCQAGGRLHRRSGRGRNQPMGERGRKAATMARIGQQRQHREGGGDVKSNLSSGCTGGPER